VYSYRAYGLEIRSALPLPELPAGEAGVDVDIRVASVPSPPVERDAEGGGFWATPDEAGRVLDGVGAFLVRGGREIIVDPAPGADARVLRLTILGSAFALLLHQRGRFVLHASAVEDAGGAVVFAGGSGWGKSTLAAALHARGCGMVADDVTAIFVGRETPVVAPAFPQLKLWPEAVMSLGGAPEILARVHPLFEKRAHRVMRGFAQRPLPLRRIYVLAAGTAPTMEPLPPQEAFLELVHHWYGARFGDRLLRVNGAAASHFQQCATLVAQVECYRLRRAQSMGAILALADVVKDHLVTAGTAFPCSRPIVGSALPDLSVGAAGR
jgi:hypothetical protein